MAKRKGNKARAEVVLQSWLEKNDEIIYFFRQHAKKKKRKLNFRTIFLKKPWKLHIKMNKE